MGEPGSAADDTALVARVADGDRGALEQLYRRHAGWLIARLDARCGDPDLADIALQDTFLAVWTKPGAYRGEGAVGAWLWGIAIRRLIDQLRKRKATPIDPAHITEPMIDAGRLTSGATFGTIDPLPVDADLQRALHALTPDLRAVLIATAIDGLSTKEAARLLGVPQGTVKTRLMRARHALQEALA
jgi:RNA polymerase sigma-70 factor (ECF subfamily)